MRFTTYHRHDPSFTFATGANFLFSICFQLIFLHILNRGIYSYKLIIKNTTRVYVLYFSIRFSI